MVVPTIRSGRPALSTQLAPDQHDALDGVWTQHAVFGFEGTARLDGAAAQFHQPLAVAGVDQLPGFLAGPGAISYLAIARQRRHVHLDGARAQVLLPRAHLADPLRFQEQPLRLAQRTLGFLEDARGGRCIANLYGLFHGNLDLTGALPSHHRTQLAGIERFV